MNFLGWLVLILTSLVWHVNSTNTNTNNVLCEIYQSTTIAERIHTGHMTGWECFDGEPDSSLCEEWSGVKCNRQGNVKYLDISHHNLTGNENYEERLSPLNIIYVSLYPLYCRYFAVINWKS